MKIIVTSNGEISAELDGDLGENFNAIADFQEVFGHKSCGKCGNGDLRYGVRKNADNEFREIICKNPDCRAKLAFGSNKKGGGIFPKRKDGDGNWLRDGGWVRWNPQTKTVE